MTRDLHIDSQKAMRGLLIVVVAVSLLWLNYCRFNDDLNANGEYVTAYQPPEDELARYRHPSVAGIFYAAAPQELLADVETYLKAGSFRPFSAYRPEILIVPHAGYAYSAATAAKAYAQLQKYKNIRRVVLVGPAHFYAGKGAFVSDYGFFATPLGKVKVDTAEVAALASSSPEIVVNNRAHAKEHSLEVQLPFLQKVLSGFKIVPLLYGDIKAETLAAALEKYINDKQTLIIVSADLSHYHAYDKARELDAVTAQKIENKAADIEAHESCGAVGINAALLLASEKHLRPQILDLVNSGDTVGDKNRVVGYGAWSFFPDSQQEQPQSKLDREVESLRNFASQYKTELLSVAERSLEKAISDGGRYSPSRRSLPYEVFHKGAVFVTLKKAGALRGCIGNILPQTSVVKNIADNTYKAALEDKRFTPVTKEEASNLKISVSLLSGFEEISYKDEVDLLRKINKDIDGILIQDGNRQGIFLPSVWQEIRNKTEFLRQLKIKAGINPSYWHNKIKVYRFRTVEINNED